MIKINNMKHITAIDKLESIFFHEAIPTINSSCRVIEEKAFRKLIQAAKAMEKEQIINAHLQGWSDAYDYLQDNGNKPAKQAEQYYNETYAD
jgi:hypothetical protein